MFRRSRMKRYQSGCSVCDCIVFSLPGLSSLLSSQSSPDDMVRRCSNVSARLRGSSPDGKVPPFITLYGGVDGESGAPDWIAAPINTEVRLFAADRVSCG